MMNWFSSSISVFSARAYGVYQATKQHDILRYCHLWIKDLAGVTILMALTAFIFSLSDIDTEIVGRFYNPEATKGWTAHHQQPWIFLYNYGMIPGILVAVASCGILAASYVYRRIAIARIYCLLILLSVALGPGVMVNLVLKEHTGRPRPKQIEHFGGHLRYHDALELGTPGQGKSFPCGHSSAGYFLCVLYFIFRRRHRKLGWTLLALSVIWGSLIGWGRMVGGAHFLSDVLWSAYITWLVALILYYFVLKIPSREDSGSLGLANDQKGMMAVAGGTLCLGIIVGTAASIPYFEHIHHNMIMAPGSTHIPTLYLSVENCTIQLEATESNTFTVSGEARGYRLIKSGVESRITKHDESNSIYYVLKKEGWMPELDASLRIMVPDKLQNVHLTLKKSRLLAKSSVSSSADLVVHMDQQSHADIPSNSHIRIVSATGTSGQPGLTRND